MKTAINMTSVNMIKELAEAKEFKEALSLVEQQNLEKSYNPQFLRVCGEVYLENGMYETSREVLIRAHKMAPEGNRIILELVKLYLRMGYFGLANRYYEQYKFNATEEDTGIIYAEYLMKKSQRVSAEELVALLAPAVEEQPTEEWMFELIKVYALLDNKEKIEFESSRFFEMYKNSVYKQDVQDICDDKYDINNLFFNTPKEEIEEDIFASPDIVEMELDQLEEDYKRMYPADPVILEILDDDEPVKKKKSFFSKVKMDRKEKKDRRRRKKDEESIYDVDEDVSEDKDENQEQSDKTEDIEAHDIAAEDVQVEEESESKTDDESTIETEETKDFETVENTESTYEVQETENVEPVECTEYTEEVQKNESLELADVVESIKESQEENIEQIEDIQATEDVEPIEDGGTVEDGETVEDVEPTEDVYVTENNDFVEDGETFKESEVDKDINSPQNLEETENVSIADSCLAREDIDHSDITSVDDLVDDIPETAMMIKRLMDDSKYYKDPTPKYDPMVNLITDIKVEELVRKDTNGIDTYDDIDKKNSIVLTNEKLQADKQLLKEKLELEAKIQREVEEMLASLDMGSGRLGISSSDKESIEEKLVHIENNDLKNIYSMEATDVYHRETTKKEFDFEKNSTYDDVNISHSDSVFDDTYNEVGSTFSTEVFDRKEAIDNNPSNKETVLHNTFSRVNAIEELKLNENMKKVLLTLKERR